MLNRPVDGIRADAPLETRAAQADHVHGSGGILTAMQHPARGGEADEREAIVQEEAHGELHGEKEHRRPGGRLAHAPSQC